MPEYVEDQLDAMVVGPSDTLRQVLRAIETGGQEVAFVADPSRCVLGVLTDGDVRRALLGGAGLDDTSAVEVMNREFRSVGDRDNHRVRALDAMMAFGIKQVPVLDDDGRLVGLHAIQEYLTRERRPNWAVVLAGGKGTRLRPITEHVPKPMVKVAGRPILERLVMGLVGAGIERIFLSVNYRKDMIKDHFGDGAGHGCRITYLEEDRPLGTGGPLTLLPDTPDHPVVVLNGDLVGDFRFADLLHAHEAGEYAMSMAVGLHSYEVPFGVVDVEGGIVRAVEEKPLQSWWVNYGIYIVSPEVLPLVPEGVSYPITELVTACLDRQLPVGGIQLDGEWLDIGRPSDLARARGGAASP